MKVHKSTQKAKEKHEGCIYPSNRFGDVEILEYLNSKKVVIKFINTGYISEEDWASIKSGHIKDRSIPTTCGFGFIDIEGASIGKVMTKEYKLWNNMINRCYNENLRHKNPTYKDCSVAEGWKYLSKFKEWCNSQIGFGNEGWNLDKDLLSKDCKIYSEHTCVFVPPEINGFLLNGNSYRGDLPVGVVLDKGAKKPRYRARLSKYGKYHCYGSYSNPTDAFIAYKQAKEDFAKELAEKWKDQIGTRAYNALMKYQVEITD
jgi:hypothetical protein